VHSLFSSVFKYCQSTEILLEPLNHESRNNFNWANELLKTLLLKHRCQLFSDVKIVKKNQQQSKGIVPRFRYAFPDKVSSINVVFACHNHNNFISKIFIAIFAININYINKKILKRSVSFIFFLRTFKVILLILNKDKYMQ
jgi:hypothetical protein